MSTELVLALRLEAKAAKAGIDEIRTALAALKREAGGSASASNGVASGIDDISKAAKTSATATDGSTAAIKRHSHAMRSGADDADRFAMRLAALQRGFKVADFRIDAAGVGAGLKQLKSSIDQMEDFQRRMQAFNSTFGKKMHLADVGFDAKDTADAVRGAKERIAALKATSDAQADFNKRMASLGNALQVADVKVFGTEMQTLGRSLRSTDEVTKNATKSTHAHTNALGQALKTGAQLAAVYGSLRAVTTAFGAGIDYNKTLEGARLAIASVVAANEKVVDSQGRQIEGVEKLRVAQTQVASVMDQLVIKARETGTPIQVLVAGFQAAVAPASAIGLTLGQTSDIVVGLTNAMKAMNIPLDQQRQEIQDILNADIDRNSHVAKNMQLNGTILKQWKEQGTLAQNLLMLLKDYNVAAGEFKNTWGGATAVMKGNFEALMGVLTGPSFEVLKAEFKKLADIFASDEARNEAVEYGHALADGLGAALSISYTIADVLKSTADGWMTLWRVVKGPEADQAYLGARDKAFDSGLKALMSKKVGTKGLPGEDSGLFSGRDEYGLPYSDMSRIPRPPKLSEGDFEDFRQRIPAWMNAEQKRALENVYLNSQAEGERARSKVLGFSNEGPGSGKAGLGGYSTSPAGGVGASPADKEKARKDLSNALKLARAGREGVPQASAVVKAYEQFLGNKALDQDQLKVDLQAARQELTQAIVKASAKDAKAAGKQSFGARLQAQALADMPDESAALREMRELLAQGDPLDKARNRWMQGANKRPKIAADLTRIDRDSSMRLRSIDRAEEVAKAGFDPDPTSRLNKEIALRRQAIEDEFNARREDAAALASTEMDARLKLLAEANAFRRESEAQLRSDERIGRMQIEDDAGKKRLEFAAQAVSMLGGAVAGAVRGQGLNVGGILAGVGGIAGTALGGPVGGAVGGAAGEVVGAIVDVLTESFDAERQKQLDILKRQDDVAKATEAAANAMADAEQQTRDRVRSERVKTIADAIAAGKNIDDEIKDMNRKTDLKARNATAKEIAESDAKAMIEARKKMVGDALGVSIPFGDPTNAGQGTRLIASMPNGIGAGATNAVKTMGDWWNNLPFWAKNKVEPPPEPQIPFPKQSAPDLPLIGTAPDPMTGAVGDSDAVRYDPKPHLVKTYTYGLKPVAPYLEQKTETVANDLGAKFAALEQALLRSIEVTESRGTERNPLITQPPKRSAFDFAPRSFFLRAGGSGTSRGMSSGNALPRGARAQRIQAV